MISRLTLFFLVAIACCAQRTVGGGQIKSVSGTGSTIVTTTGTQTSGDCVKIDANGNHVAAGSACGSGGSVTPGGTSGAVQFNNAGALGGSAELTFRPYGSGLQGLYIGAHSDAFGPFASGISVFQPNNSAENHFAFTVPTGGGGFVEQDYTYYNSTTNSFQDLFYTGASAELSGNDVTDQSWFVESVPDYVSEITVRRHLIVIRNASSFCWNDQDNAAPARMYGTPDPDACLTRPSPGTIRLTDGLTGLANLEAGRYRETLHTPASSSEACTAGQFSDDANFHYVCTATNTWKRVALSSF